MQEKITYCEIASFFLPPRMAAMEYRIKEIRLEQKLTQKQVAERMGDGASDVDVSRWERNEVEIPDSRKKRLANALGVSVHELIAGGDGWPFDIEAMAAALTMAEDVLSVKKSRIDGKERVRYLARLYNLVRREQQAKGVANITFASAESELERMKH